MKDYLKLIDDKFEESKEKGLSRLSIEWGKWSREMNLEIRGMLASGDYDDTDEEIKLKYLFIYWTNRSRLLELFHKGQGNSTEASILEMEAQDLRAVIKGEKEGEDINMETPGNLMSLLGIKLGDKK